MLEQFYYDSDLIGGSLMVRESRLIADLLLREATPEQWHQAIQIDNILQKRTAASAQRNATAIRKRLERLEPDFWKALRDGDDELATQVAFCGALERNLLLIEFMETVMREAYISQAQYLDSYIWSDFLEKNILSQSKSRVEVDLFPKVLLNQASCIPLASVIRACQAYTA